MKIVVFSDVQGNLDEINKLKKSLVEFPRDMTVCLGDIVQKAESFDENRVVDAIREMRSESVRGNHEEKLCDGDISKIQPANLDYLIEKIQEKIERSPAIFYHSSLRQKGKRLRKTTDLLEESRFIRSNHPQMLYAFFGHSHIPTLFEYDPKQDSGNISELKRETKLEEGKSYLMNPGSLGAKYTPHTLMVLDTGKNKLYFYGLDEFEDISARRSIIMRFEEDWMPHLKGDKWSYVSLSKEAEGIERNLNRNRRFDGVISVLRQLRPPENHSKKGNEEYYRSYSEKLANAVDSLFTSEIKEHYPSIDYPFNARSYYMRTRKHSIKGVDFNLPKDYFKR